MSTLTRLNLLLWSHTAFVLLAMINNCVLYSKLASLYAQSAREVQRCGFLKALINQYGLWVGLGDTSMTMIDCGCGTGALSQVSEPFCGWVCAYSGCLGQAFAPHLSKIRAIDSSKGMVDLYNATYGGVAMKAVQGDLVAGVLMERGEIEGNGTLGLPKELGHGRSLLGFCVRSQLSDFESCMTCWSGC